MSEHITITTGLSKQCEGKPIHSFYVCCSALGTYLFMDKNYCRTHAKQAAFEYLFKEQE